MKKATLAVFIVLLFISIGQAAENRVLQSQKDFTIEQFKGTPWCRQIALFTALTYGEYYPVRFKSGPILGGPGRHVQAQAFIDGKWEWLKYDRWKNRVYHGEKDNFQPTETESLSEYFIGYIGQFEMTSNEKNVPLFAKYDVKIIDGVRVVKKRMEVKKNEKNYYVSIFDGSVTDFPIAHK